MRIGLAFPEQLTGLLEPVRDELDHLVARINGGFGVEHAGDGTHSDITPDSVTTTEIASLLEFIRIEAGLKFLSGPWLFCEEGNDSFSKAALRATQITADQNDYNPNGLSRAIILEIESDAARTVTGITVARRQRRWLQVVNRGNFTITLSHNSGSSSAVNRMFFPAAANYGLRSGECALFYYDVGSEIWRPIGAGY